MKNASAGLNTALQQETTTLCRLLRITRFDGTVLRFTDAVDPVTFEGFVYREDVSFTSSAILTTAELMQAQSVTINISLADDAITEADLRSRRYRGAKGEIMLIDYTTPANGVVKMYTGRFGRIDQGDKGRVVIDLKPISSAAGRNITTERYSATCRAALGDARCTVDIEATAVNITVTAVTAGGAVIAAAALTQADDYWLVGTVKWLTGLNTGLTNDLTTSDQSSTAIMLVSPPIIPIAVGDTGRVYRGCTKQVTYCRDEFNNVVNFRGEPFVPQGSTYTLPSLTGGNSGYLGGP